jgi:hypothetical protein
MNRWRLTGLTFTSLAIFLLTFPEQGYSQKQPTVTKGTSIRGRVVRAPASGQVVIQTTEGKEITLYTDPRTTYRINEREARLADIRVGAEINAIYNVRDNRYMAGEIVVGAQTTAPGPEIIYPSSASQTIQGRITKIASPNFLVVTTTDGKEVQLYLDLQRDFTIRFVDSGDKRIATSVVTATPTTLETTTGPTNGATVEGTIVRVGVKTNPQEIVVRTKTGQEVILFTSPKTTYRLENRDVRFEDVQEGLPVMVIYDVDNQRKILRSLRGLRRK